MAFDIFQRAGRQQFPTTGMKLVRISQKSCFLLNKAATSWLNSESVLLLFDKEAKSVAIRRCAPDTEFAVTVQVKKHASRIATYAFMKWIDYPVAKVYVVEANEAEGQLEFTVEYGAALSAKEKKE